MVELRGEGVEHCKRLLHAEARQRRDERELALIECEGQEMKDSSCPEGDGCRILSAQPDYVHNEHGYNDRGHLAHYCQDVTAEALVGRGL